MTHETPEAPRDLRRELTKAMQRCTPNQRIYLRRVREAAGTLWSDQVMGVGTSRPAGSKHSVHRWLREDRVRAVLALHAEIADADSDLTVERIKREYGRLAFSNIAQFYNPNNTFKAPSEWSEDMAAAVSEIHFDALGRVEKIKLHPKSAPLDTTAKIRNVLVEKHKHEITGPNGGPLLVKDATSLTDEELEAISRGGSPTPAEPPKSKN